MPKNKTHRGAAKRFKIRPSGTVKCKQPYRGHLLECKSRNRKRNLRGTTSVGAVDVHRIYGMLPNG
jgi:large subunit ribosomal protein L35